MVMVKMPLRKWRYWFYNYLAPIYFLGICCIWLSVRYKYDIADTYIAPRKLGGVALYLHVGYVELWDDILKCTNNVAAAISENGYHNNMDIFVSVSNAQRERTSFQTEQNMPNPIHIRSMQDDMKLLKEQYAHIGTVLVKGFQNEGADIGPFLKMLQETTSHDQSVNEEYQLVLKMHTKNDDIWRSRAFESLCGTKEHVTTILSNFDRNEKLDMLVPQGTLFGPNTSVSKIFPHIVRKYHFVDPKKHEERKLMSTSFASNVTRLVADAFDPKTRQILNHIRQLIAGQKAFLLRHLHDDNMLIAAGTMFWIRYSALNVKALTSILPEIEKFFMKGYVENLGVEHALERLFPTEIALRKRHIAEIAPAPLVLAMYFPQYHNCSENNKFWGEGFTEWTILKPLEIVNIKKPLPVEEGGLGYYDLLDKETRKAQADLASSYGVHGFIYYHYWFSGPHAPLNHLVMQKIPEQMLLDGEPNLPFAFSWANEPWTKRWTGMKEASGETLLSQEYGTEKEWREHFAYLLTFFNHPNYIRVDGKPIFIIYRIGHVGSKLEPMMNLWRELALQAGLSGLHLINTIGNFRHTDVQTEALEKETTIDASFHFWPQLLACGENCFSEKELKPTLWSEQAASTHDFTPLLDTYPTQYWGAFVGFDRRPRDNTADPILRSPEEFKISLYNSFQSMAEYSQREIQKNFFFITAWNEWNEQAVLEPNNKDGFKYLNAIKTSLTNFPLTQPGG